jgi:hypothetical protein
LERFGDGLLGAVVGIKNNLSLRETTALGKTSGGEKTAGFGYVGADAGLCGVAGAGGRGE